MSRKRLKNTGLESAEVRETILCAKYLSNFVIRVSAFFYRTVSLRNW